MPQYQGVWSLQQQMQALTSGRWATDPLFDYTTLLLQGDAGANGAQNNVFYDTSPNQFAITRNGNTTQGTFSPFSLQPGEWSNYFGASSTYLSFGSNSAFGFSTGAYTVEFWYYPTALSGLRWLCSNDASGGINIYMSDNQLNWGYWGAGGFITVNNAFNLNQWNHVALCRASTSSNQASVFINGIRVANGTDSRDWTVNGPFVIGGTSQSSNSLDGYISNLRVVKGSDVYGVSNTRYTVPTTPLTAITNTSLLACQSNRFRDASANAFAVTVTGTPSVQAFSPFAPQFQYTASVTGGSGYFDGTGDYLSVADNAAFEFGSGDFTLEAFAYCTDFTPERAVIAKWTANGTPNSNSWLLIFAAGGAAQFITSTNGQNIDINISGGTAYANSWNHIAASRSGNTYSLYLNGTRVATTTNANSLADVGTSVEIGRYSNGNGIYAGYISGARIVKGTAVYTGTTLTVPTAPPTAVTNTSLLLNFTNAGILDGTMKNNLETVGNAQVSTSVVKYGSGSMYFDGTGDYLRPNSGNIFNFGTGDFTVEFWLYLNSTGNQTFIDCRPGSAGDYMLFDYSSNVLRYYVGSTTVITGSSLSTGQWYHIALSRISGTARMFINGTQTGSTATHTTNLLSSSNPYIASNYVPGDYLNGYLDDLRITKGIARYTQNFIPPSVALPRQ